MWIEQLPIVNLILFMGMALIVPLLKKRNFNRTLWLGFFVLLMVIASTILILFHIHANGPIYYHFGGHQSFIGIEFLIDELSAFMTLFIVVLALIVYIYSCGDATDGIESKEYGRYYILLYILLFSMFGMLYTNDLFNTYVFMEILSITTCSIISIKRKKETYTSAFRYVMLNEIGSLSYLFGVALLYMMTGYTNMELVFEGVNAGFQTFPVNVIIALGFMVIGVSIKAAIFPFHIWLPDAHASAPSASSAILSAIVVKVYLIVLMKILFRIFGIDILNALNLSQVILIVASVGMVMGSIFAIAQKDIKRMLGYSSVAQIGYILLGIGLLSSAGLTAAFFHIISHGLMKVALFLSVGVVIYQRKIRKVSDFDGLGYHLPISMGVFTIAALGMIGIPLTSGFISKFYLGIAVLDQSYIILLIIIILSSILNVIYYLPIVISAFLKNNPEKIRLMHIERVPKLMIIPIMMLGILILFIGIYPNILLDWISRAVSALI